MRFMFASLRSHVNGPFNRRDLAVVEAELNRPVTAVTALTAANNVRAPADVGLVAHLADDRADLLSQPPLEVSGHAAHVRRLAAHVRRLAAPRWLGG